MATRTVPFKDGMKIGLGYDRLTGDRTPSPAVQGPSITGVQGALGHQVTIDATTIKDVETLHKSLGINIDAGGSYMGFSGSAKVDYANSCDFSSFSTYVVVRVTVKNPAETIDSPVFSPDANELLIALNKERFRLRFGDTFISGVLKGGEYFAIYQITGSDQKEKESVAVDVHAAFKGGITNAELNTKIKIAEENTVSHLEVRVLVFRQGAITTADLTLEDIMKTARDFPLGVSGDKAFPFAVLLNDYHELKLPDDKFVFVDIQQRQDVLEDLAKKRFEFLELRDDLKFILNHIDDFQNADGSPVDRDKVIRDLDEAVDAINTMQDQASACTRNPDQCEFTKFEVAKFNLPSPKKPLVSAPVTPPPTGPPMLDLVGQFSGPAADLFACINFEAGNNAVNHCLQHLFGQLDLLRDPRAIANLFLFTTRNGIEVKFRGPFGRIRAQSPAAGIALTRGMVITLDS